MQMFDLSGKVAIVTGGNGGIGLGMAQGLAAAGASRGSGDWAGSPSEARADTIWDSSDAGLGDPSSVLTPCRKLKSRFFF